MGVTASAGMGVVLGWDGMGWRAVAAEKNAVHVDGGGSCICRGGCDDGAERAWCGPQ